MYEIGDMILYGHEGICEIKNIVTRKIKNTDKQYYQLSPLDNHITIYVQIDNQYCLSKMRKILSKDNIYKLIKTMPDNETIWIHDKNIRKQKYNNIINCGNHEQLVKLIKTLYLNKLEQEKAGKKFHVQDQYLLKTAEKILYDEFSITLDLKPEQILSFILNTIEIKEK